MNNSELAHTFANKDYGRNGGRHGSSFYSQESNNALYSYGDHFMVAKHLNPLNFNGFDIAITSRSYSVTTQRHISLTRRACSHLEVLECAHPENLGADPSQTKPHEHMCNLDTFWDAPLTAAKDYRGKDTLADAQRLEIIKRGINLFERYKKACGLTFKVIKEASPESLKNYRMFTKGDWQEKMRKAQEMAEASKRKAAEKAAAKAKTLLPDWIAGGRHDSRLFALPVACRVSGDGERVETSHIASIPIRDAKTLWLMINRRKKSDGTFEPWKRNGERQALGSYDLASITKDGGIVVGCHRISYEAMKRISEKVIAS